MRSMLTIPHLRLFSLALAIAALAAGYIWNGIWELAVICIFLGILGWALDSKNRPANKKHPAQNSAVKTGPALFLGIVAAAGLGAAIALPVLPMLAAVLAGLAYWDLDGFQERLERVPASEDTRLLEKLHLQRLAWVLGLGLALSLPGLLLDIQLNLGWAILLGLLIVVGIRLGIGFLRQNQE